MNCKNCEYGLQETAKFCQSCGARIIYDRLSLKKLTTDFINKVFGWENNYFRTFRTMMISPDVVVSDYIGGIRKRHMPPITFLLIGLTIATLVFNTFSEKYVELNSDVLIDENYYRTQFELKNGEKTSTNLDDKKKYEEAFQTYKNQQKGFQTNIIKGILKYLNLITFIFMPFYTLISMLVFGRKTHNYSEHLVINCYIQGLSMIGTTLLFIAALIVHPNIYLFGITVAPFYYSFTYKKLYKLSFGKLLLKIGKFLIIFALVAVLFSILIILITFIYLLIFGKESLPI